jgi:hypothetical protein
MNDSGSDLSKKQILLAAHTFGATHLRKETPEEVEERKLYAKRKYDENVRRLNAKMQMRGIFRVTMNSFGEIIDITKVKSCPPAPSSFTLIAKGPGVEPEFGTFRTLTDTQRTVADCLVVDLGKIMQTKDVVHDYRLAWKGTDEEILGVHHLKDMESRFGDLPPSKIEMKEREREIARRKAENDRLEMESLMIELEQTGTFEDLIEREKRKKQRKKKPRKGKTAKGDNDYNILGVQMGSCTIEEKPKSQGLEGDVIASAEDDLGSDEEIRFVPSTNTIRGTNEG